MKRFSAIFLASAFLLAACSTGNSNSAGETAESSKPEVQVSNESRESSEKKNTVLSENTLSVEPVTVVDNDECSIQVLDIALETSTSKRSSVKLQFENKSLDKTYTFSIDDGYINGVKCKPMVIEYVAPGQKSIVDAKFSDGKLKENGIGDFTDIKLSFRVHDGNDWSVDPIVLEDVHLYPFGEDRATKFVREPETSDNVVVDNEYATAIVTGYEKDDTRGYTVNMFLVNNSDTDLSFAIEEASVNGSLSDPLFSVTVAAGECAFISPSWTEINTAEVEEIKFTLHAYDAYNWEDNDIFNEQIILNP